MEPWSAGSWNIHRQSPPHTQLNQYQVSEVNTEGLASAASLQRFSRLHYVALTRKDTFCIIPDYNNRHILLLDAQL